MRSVGARKRRLVWVPVAIVIFSLGVSSLTGVDFLAILKPFTALFAVGMFFGWVAYEVAEFNPYQY